jgi:hypothetical protein
MTKKAAKKRRINPPKVKREVSNDLYMFCKGQAKRKRIARRIKKMQKHIVIKNPDEELPVEPTTKDEKDDLNKENL